MNGSQTEIQDPDNPGNKPKQFAFDYSYWSHDGFNEEPDGYLKPKDASYADQQKVFDDLGKGVLENSWNGYNCSLFAYGQTGSGKSYSMVGFGSNKGIVPLVCEELFRMMDEKKSSLKEGEEFGVTLSMLEIYNEQVRDLLNIKSLKGGLKVRQHPSKGFYVESLTTPPVNSYAQIDSKINEGTRNRTVASTNMNATSSRAHTIVAVTFVQKTINDAGQNMTKSSVINLVDLAGSERADSTGATGNRLKEGSAINQSLSTLGNCIKALADQSSGKKKVLVPFRDSVLTRLLQNALGGNSKTIMIAALSPADINYEETLSTLRFADRAKAIKTMAVINESPTDKLIRELREENQKLMEMLKAGGGTMMLQESTKGYSTDEVEEMKKGLEEQLKENQREMEEMKKSWEQRMAESQADSMTELQEEKKKQEERKVVPHFWNLNEDPALTAMVIHFCRPGKCRVGNKSASPTPEILLNGLSIQKEHAVVENNKGVVKLVPIPGAKITVNGEQIKASKELHHNDRVIFGSNHLYVFHHPQDEAKQIKQGLKIETPTYNSVQEELAQHTGLVKNEVGKSKEDMLLQEDLIQMLPMVNEANAMSEELDKRVKFELALVSPQARGLTEGNTEVMVKMKNLDNDNEWMLDRNDFINRKYLMQEMYQNYMEGAPDWDVEQDKDPFWEPADRDVLIGTTHVYPQSLAYLIELQESFKITDYRGAEHGVLTVEMVPCTSNWKPIEEDYVEDPNELLGKELNFIVKIPHARGLPSQFVQTFCKYKFYLDKQASETEMISGTMNPNFDHEKKFVFKPITQQFIDYLASQAVVFEVWGRQKDTGNAGKTGKAAGMDKKTPAKTGVTAQTNGTAQSNGTGSNAVGSKGTGSKDTGSNGAASNNAQANDKTASQLKTQKKMAERAEGKLQLMQNLLDTAKSKKQTTIQISNLEAILKGHDLKYYETSMKKNTGAKGSQACSLQ
ncbi:kinesin-like protein KIF28P [Gigantopelta aegis]|uniref:kinesin-like protein KIF28P n=1 Tax=Gigantopelta aegis TaxID=1735272 RepID=UPI001B88E12F|nr:kinesin-like protein KIF28P [Gigantopelta aegis]